MKQEDINTIRLALVTPEYDSNYIKRIVAAELILDKIESIAIIESVINSK